MKCIKICIRLKKTTLKHKAKNIWKILENIGGGGGLENKKRGGFRKYREGGVEGREEEGGGEGGGGEGGEEGEGGQCVLQYDYRVSPKTCFMMLGGGKG